MISPVQVSICKEDWVINNEQDAQKYLRDPREDTYCKPPFSLKINYLIGSIPPKDESIIEVLKKAGDGCVLRMRNWDILYELHPNSLHLTMHRLRLCLSSR